MTTTELVPRIGTSKIERPRVVLACTEPAIQDVLMNLLKQNGLKVLPSSYLNETKYLAAEEDLALVICQVRFSDGDFRDLLRFCTRRGLNVPVIVCADFYDPAVYLEAMELGAFDYFAYPYHREGMEWIIDSALREAQSSEGSNYEERRTANDTIPC